MSNKLLKMLKPYKVMLFQHHNEAHRVARDKYSEGEKVLMYWADGTWVLKYK